MSLSIEQLKKRAEKARLQEWQNEQCLCAVHTIRSHIDYNMWTHWYPLYHCKAAYAVFAEREDKTHWYALRSYKTLVCVAVYDSDRRRLIIYDVLRWTYGYTATSAQHIAKFRRMLLQLLTDCKQCTTYTMRPTMSD